MTTHRPRRRGRAAAAVALAGTMLLAASGCSGSDADKSSSAKASGKPSASTSATTSSSPSSSPTSGSTTTSGSSPSSGPSATGAPEQALASKEFTVTGTYAQTPVRMRLDVMELKRRGDLLQLTANLVNTEQDRSRDLRWQVASRFAGEYRDDLTGTSGAFSGLVLTDIAAKKRYLVAADSANNCVCTVQLSSTFVGAGQSVELSATYAAPPTSTTKLDVEIPTLGTFRDLPVT